ncbi:hypothetical protein FQA39_LY13032 [Lamprigera yunnana]|nr:hypothetical protein FQA39_LY13032 [Lamprigera yunnana]
MNLSIRAISDKHNVKISVVDLSEAINEICELQIEHNQPIIDYTLTQITVEFNDNKVRSSFRIGDAEVGNAEAERLINEYGGLAHAMGSKGQMVIGRSILNSKDKYYSNIEINHQKINEMFMKYLKDSDQIQSIIVIGVESNQAGKITKAVGMLLQMLPGYTDEDIDYLEEKLDTVFIKWRKNNGKLTKWFRRDTRILDEVKAGKKTKPSSKETKSAKPVVEEAKKTKAPTQEAKAAKQPAAKETKSTKPVAKESNTTKPAKEAGNDSNTAKATSNTGKPTSERLKGKIKYQKELTAKYSKDILENETMVSTQNYVPNPDKHIIELKNVRKSYITGDLETPILKGIDIILDKGLDKATEGDVFILGSNLSLLKDSHLTKFRRKHVGFIFQQYNLLTNLTAKENAEVGYNLSSDKDTGMNIEEIFKTIGMEEQMNKYPHQMSGGQQQRVSIARALAKNPNILFADEPTGALDEEMGRKVLEILVKVNKTYKTTVIVVTHNPNIAKIANTIIHIKNGLIDQLEHNKKPADPSSIE